MSREELDRLGIIQRVDDKVITQHQAACLLQLTTRQVRRLLRAYQANQATGLISKRRGKPSQ